MDLFTIGKAYILWVLPFCKKWVHPVFNWLSLFFIMHYSWLFHYIV